MKKLYVCTFLALVLFVLFSGTAVSSIVTLDLLANYQQYGGVTGEVHMSNSPGYTDFGYIFCLNRYNEIYVPNIYNAEVGPLDIGVQLEHRNITQLNEAAWIMHTYDPAGVDPQTGAAVQLAIWNVIGQGLPGNADFGFKASNGVTVGEMVANALAAANLPNFAPLNYVYLDLHHDIHGNVLNAWARNNLQDFIADPVPEPSAFLLLGCGMVGFAARRFGSIKA
jgi:hypothetical protein